MNSLQTYKILIVDDSFSDRLIIREVLRRANTFAAEIEEAASLEEAFAILTTESFHFIISDLWLPDSSGSETVERILTYLKENEKELAIPLPILFVTTGNATISQGVAAIKAGAHDFLGKGLLELKRLPRMIELAQERGRLLQEQRQLVIQLERSARFKTKFLARMSHDIRTPLNSIIGMADILRETELDDQQRRYVEIFRSAGNALLDLVNDILDISKIEANQLRLFEDPIDVEEIIERIGDLAGFQCRRNRNQLLIDIAEDVPLEVIGDRARIGQILSNFVSNAVKFTQDGYIKINLNLQKVEGDIAFLRFSVSDTGPGIPTDKLHQVFQEFNQGVTEFSHKFGGTGLGLSIARHLAHLMDGKVWLDSEPGKGTIAYFEVPLQMQPETRTGNQLLPATEKLHALILSADLEESDLLVRSLGRWNVRTQVVRCPREFSQSFKTNEFDFFVVDCRLPGGGLEFLKEFPDIEKIAAKTIPLLPAAHRRDDPKELARLGVHNYLVKPLKRREMYQALHNLFPEQFIDIAKTQQIAPENTGTMVGDRKTSTRQLKILVADDLEENRYVLETYLKGTGHKVDYVADGQEVIDFVQGNELDVVLLDMRMPKVDGYEAAKAIRDWEEKQGKTPVKIIALTGDAMAEQVEQCFSCGCDDHLPKPIRKQVLLERLEQV